MNMYFSMLNTYCLSWEPFCIKNQIIKLENKIKNIGYLLETEFPFVKGRRGNAKLYVIKM